MTRVLKLVKGSTTLNLLNATDGITLRAGGDNWQPQYPVVTVNGDPDPVVETMRLQCRGTSQNAIAGTMQIWADMMRGASIYRTDANGTAPVWLHAKLDDETNERRSIVHRIDAAWVDSGMTEAIDQDVLLFDAAIERGPYWESTTPVTMGTASFANLAENPGFEMLGAGSPDIFAGWTENWGNGNIADGGTINYSGSHSAKLTTGYGATTYLQQTYSVIPETRYTIMVAARGDGGTASYPALDLFDLSNMSSIMSIGDAPAPGTAWYRVMTTFNTPAGCTSLRVLLQCSQQAIGNIVYFDDVYLSSVTRSLASVHSLGVIAGDVGARPSPMVLYQPASGTATWGEDIDTVWIGSRTDARFSLSEYWFYEWECEAPGVSLGTDAARVLDLTASRAQFENVPSYAHKITITPGTTAWSKRLTWTRAALDAYTQNGTGQFLWLLRTKVSAGTWNVGLRFLYGSSSTSDTYISGPKIEITETDWAIKEMGISDIPMFDAQALADALSSTASNSWTVEIWAERVGGAGTLDLDCMIPLPIDEGYLIVKNANMVAGASPRALVIAQSPLGQWGAAVVGSTGLVESLPEVSAHNFALGPGETSVVLVCAANKTEDLRTPHILSSPDTTIIDAPAYYPRWLSLRGAE